MLRPVLYDAYEAYDAIASPDERVTRKQFAAVNEAMKAFIKLDDWRQFVSPHSLPHLSAVPKDLDLIDSSDDDYASGKEAVRRVYETLCWSPRIDDMASSKVCHLKRPKLIAISDSYVRAILLGPDTRILPNDPTRGSTLANRGLSVMDAVRSVGRLNAEALQRLFDYTLTVELPDGAARLSKARVLDIVLWTEVAAQKHPIWTAWKNNRLDPRVTCPRCGKPMFPQKRKDGSKEFYTCPRYPSCDGGGGRDISYQP
jgi:hypothetical protein